MSLCTLPQPVSPELLSVSPIASVALFITKTQLSLCRKSGQQVWSARIPTRSPVVAVNWRWTGEMFALIHENSEVSLCSIVNGRPIETLYDLHNVSSLAWALPLRGQSEAAATISAPQTSFFSSLDHFTSFDELLEDTSLAALGTVDGKVRICLYGALEIGDVPLSQNPPTPVDFVFANEQTEEYLAVQGNVVTMIKSKTRDEERDGKSAQNSAELEEFLHIMGLKGMKISPTLRRREIRWTALATRLVDHLCRCAQQLFESIKAINKINTEFLYPIGPKGLEQMLIKHVVFGTILHAGWIQKQHEQGFKAWYKSCSQHWNALRSAFSELAPCVEKLIIAFGVFRIPTHNVLDLHKSLLSSIKAIANHYDSFEFKAMLLEKVFIDETDRPLQETLLSNESIEFLAINNNPLESPSIEFGQGLVDQTKTVSATLETAVQVWRKELISQFRVVQSVSLESRITAIRPIDTVTTAAILESNHLALFSAQSGEVMSVTPIEGVNPVFTGHGSDLISLDITGKSLVHSNGTRTALEFEPLALATRIDETEAKVVACVLSHDCQHYQFVEIPFE